MPRLRRCLPTRLSVVGVLSDAPCTSDLVGFAPILWARAGRGAAVAVRRVVERGVIVAAPPTRRSHVAAGNSFRYRPRPLVQPRPSP
jgi:hypothetical protein